MIENELAQKIKLIHESPLKMVIAVTGGGSLAIGDLLTVPGASHTVLEAVVPYSATAIVEFLQYQPEQNCSEKTARQLAVTAFRRAIKIDADSHATETSPLPKNLMGIGCTCSLASDRPKQGEHRAHWAVQTVSQTYSATVVFKKGMRSRLEEEQLVAKLLISTIASFANDQNGEIQKQIGYTDALVDDWQTWLCDDETRIALTVVAPKNWRDLLFGDRIVCCVTPDQMFASEKMCRKSDIPGDISEPSNAPMLPTASTFPKFLFPGSFNPMHQGHQRMVEIAAEIGAEVAKKRLSEQPHAAQSLRAKQSQFEQSQSGQSLQHGVALEIAVQNVDKPSLDYLEIYDRLTSIANTPGMAAIPVYLTKLPRFVDKSQFFRNVTFLVGADTLKRIAEQKYYVSNSDGENFGDTSNAVETLIKQGCRFLCFAREDNGQIETAEKLNLPASLRSIVESVSPDLFCDSISSTALRRK